MINTTYLETKRRHPGVKESAEEAIVKEQLTVSNINTELMSYTIDKSLQQNIENLP